MRGMRKNKRGGRLGRGALRTTDKRARDWSSDGRAKTLPDQRYLAVHTVTAAACTHPSSGLACPPCCALRLCFSAGAVMSRLSRLA